MPLRNSTFWIGVLLMAMGVVWLAAGLALPQTARYAAIGPGMFVTLIGAALLALGAAHMVQALRASPLPDADAGGGTTGWSPALGWMLLGVGLPVLLMRHAGFAITAGLCFAAVARAFGSRRPGLDVLLGLAVASAAFLLFSWLGVSLGKALPWLSMG